MATRKIKTGILMLNMGGPRTLSEVPDFLTRLFTDREIIQLPMQSKLGPIIAKNRAPKVQKKYAEIGGGSPILLWTNKQGKLMTDILDKECPDTAPHKHYVGFRYAEPLMEHTLNEMEKDGVEKAVAFSQYPQYSCTTSGSSFSALWRYYKNKTNSTIKWSFIDRWPKQDSLLECFAQLIKKELNGLPEKIQENIVILFSAHALPMKVVSRGDTYPAEVASTVLGVMEKLQWSHPYRLVWQSKVGPKEWLSPQTEEAMKGLADMGQKHIMVVPISFVNEHIETLHELDIEYGKELATKIGVETFCRVPTPNDHPVFIKGLADLVKCRLTSSSKFSKQLVQRCPLCTSMTCVLTKKWISSWN